MIPLRMHGSGNRTHRSTIAKHQLALEAAPDACYINRVAHEAVYLTDFHIIYANVKSASQLSASRVYPRDAMASSEGRRQSRFHGKSGNIGQQGI